MQIYLFNSHSKKFDSVSTNENAFNHFLIDVDLSNFLHILKI